MSDGAPWDEHPAYQEIDQIKKEKWISKVEFLAVGFGNGGGFGGGGSNFRVLDEMAKRFPNGKMQNAPTVTELK